VCGSIRPEANQPSLDHALLGIIEQAMKMEDRFGQVYPVYNACRGITAYQFVLEIVHARAGCVVLQADDLWYRLVEVAKKAPQSHSAVEMVAVPEGVATFELGGRWLRVACRDGVVAHYPLPMKSAAMQLVGSASYSVGIRQTRRVVHAEVLEAR